MNATTKGRLGHRQLPAHVAHGRARVGLTTAPERAQDHVAMLTRVVAAGHLGSSDWVAGAAGAWEVMRSRRAVRGCAVRGKAAPASSDTDSTLGGA